jgi:DNA-binding XRE family transcriptional regulator
MHNLPVFTDKQLSEIRTIVGEIVEYKVDELFDRIQRKKKTIKEGELFRKERLTQKELCELFELSKTTVIRWEKKGLIRGEKSGKNKLYSKKKILELFELERIRSTVNYLKSSSPYMKELDRKRKIGVI